KAGLIVEPVPERQPFLARNFKKTTSVGFMLKSTWRARAGREDFLIACTNVGHLFVGDRSVVERCAPVWPPLKHGQLADLVRNLADHLDGGGAGADDGDLLAGHSDGFMGPIIRVERAPLEGFHSLQ